MNVLCLLLLVLARGLNAQVATTSSSGLCTEDVEGGCNDVILVAALEPESNQGGYISVAVGHMMDDPNRRFALVFGEEGESIHARGEVPYRSRFFENVDLVLGYKKKGNIRVEGGFKWTTFRLGSASVTDTYSDFTSPSLGDPGGYEGRSGDRGIVGIGSFGAIADNLGFTGGLSYDYDRSQGGYDEIYYFGSSIGLMRSRLSNGSNLLGGESEDGDDWAPLHQVEGGLLLGVTESIDVQIAFQVMRIGGLIGFGDGTIGAPGTNYGTSVSDVSFNVAPYNRYVLKFGILRFFGQN